MPLTHEMRERILRNETVRAWISKRAYELHQLGGNEYGKATQDWLNAESELLALASLLEEIFCSKSTPQQAINERRKAKTSPKSQRRRTGSTSASPREAPPITDKKLDEGSQVKPEQKSKERKTR
jgi:Protein of unknown function (DUF2934)